MPTPSASVIIPAQNEAAVLPRLLRRLTAQDGPGFDVIVVCNGCTDRTAAVAAAFPGVRVLETPVPSKSEALRLGDRSSAVFPRIYLDADVEIDRRDLEVLAAALRDGVLIASARRVIPRTGVRPPVRWYYDVWEALPQVAAGVFGRGVIALSEKGFRRIAELPELIADDLAMSAAFTADERTIVDDATVVVHPPRVWADLIRRRTRAAAGTAQAYGSEQVWSTDSRTSAGDLVRLLRRRPALGLRMPFFLAATVLARRAARRGDYTGWLRDESSRK
jgi:glycosyltransferase involved in cell wall biosynthesis